MNYRTPQEAFSAAGALARDREGLVEYFLQAGSIRQAIAVYQEETRATPGEARRAVLDLAARHGYRQTWFGLWRRAAYA